VGKFRVVFHRRAAKTFQRLPTDVRRRIEAAIERLRDNPFASKDVVKLKGELAGLYRLRLGTYRIVYAVDEERRVIFVEAIGTRGEVY